MSIESERVIKFRNNRKDLMIAAFGSKCGICGYNKCQSALHFHHLDKSKKSFSIARIRANPISWDKLVEELRKCILVCSNCHMEIHEGLIDIPKDIKKFNEEFATYSNAKIASNINELRIGHKCLECDNIIENKQKKYCSKICSNLAIEKIRKSRQVIDWEQEKENLLYLKNIEKYSFVDLGKIYLTSDKTVAKWYYRFNSQVVD